MTDVGDDGIWKDDGGEDEGLPELGEPRGMLFGHGMNGSWQFV